MHLSGAWAGRRHKKRPLSSVCRLLKVEGASDHQQNPFAALISKNVDEEQERGSLLSSLVYSSNFIAPGRGGSI